MSELVLVPSRWNLTKGAILCLVCFLPAISLAFHVSLFGGALSFFGFYPDYMIIERAVGTILVAALSYVFADIITYFIWRTPVVFANEDGINVKGRFIPWDEYEGVDVKRASGRMGAANFVRVRGRRSVSIKDHEMSHRPEMMAAAISEYAEAALAGPQAESGFATFKDVPRRSRPTAQGSLRPGFSA